MIVYPPRRNTELGSGRPWLSVVPAWSSTASPMSTPISWSLRASKCFVVMLDPLGYRGFLEVRSFLAHDSSDCFHLADAIITRGCDSSEWLACGERELRACVRAGGDLSGRSVRIKRSR